MIFVIKVDILQQSYSTMGVVWTAAKDGRGTAGVAADGWQHERRRPSDIQRDGSL